MKTFLLIYLAMTTGGIGIDVYDKTFPTLEICNQYGASDFLANPEHWVHTTKTYNFYNSLYTLNVKDSVNGDMRIFYSCVEQKTAAT